MATRTDKIPPHLVRARPRLLIVADVPDWIFARHARVLQAGLRDDFDVDIGFMDDPIDENKYDLIHPLEWNLVPLKKIRNPRKWVTGIRSHVSWEQLSFAAVCGTLRTKFGGVYVVSRRLLDIFMPQIPDVRLVAHGVDVEYFRPDPGQSRNSDRLRVGWAGNRKFRVKGYDEFISPLATLSAVEVVSCGYGDRHLDLAGMKDFYSGIDVYVCTSISEGHNNSLLEAAAMERAIVTTDVGTVPEYLVDEESALIVPRDSAAIAAALTRLRDDRELRLRLGRRARAAVIAQYDWKSRLEDYRAFFLDAIERSHTSEPSAGFLETSTSRLRSMVKRARLAVRQH